MLGGFISIYPWLSFIYFVLIIIFSLLFKHPLYLITLFFTSLSLTFCFHQSHVLKSQLKFYLFMAALLIILNPLFVGKGTTILFYIGYRNITLESVIYGILFAISLLCVLLFFISYNATISSQKFLYLFANIIPSIAFIISVTMRFIPLFKRRTLEILAVQNTLMPLCAHASKLDKLKESTETLNTLVSWTLEESLENATSMRARGYGLFKRTSATCYTFDRRDFYILLYMIFTFFPVLIGYLIGYGQFQIYPSLASLDMSFFQRIHYLFFILFSLLPIIIEVREHLRWQFMKFKT